MEDIIKKIISMEEKAEKIVQEAKNEETNLNKELEMDIKAMEKEIVNSQNRKIRQLKDWELGEAKEKAKAIEDETKEKMKDIERYAKENMDSWIAEVVKAVIRE